MAQSLSKIYIHLIFHIKNRLIPIGNDVKKELFAYMGSIIKDNGSIPILINGMHDHIHIFYIMSKNISLAKQVEEIKRHSSRWIKTKGGNYQRFSWQSGYAGFSVSQSLQEKTKHYIQNQEEHHKKLTFKEEFIAFLKEYRIEYNEQFLWTD